MGILGHFSKLARLALSSLLAVSCLNSDPRPPPGSVTFTSSSDDALREGVTTDDGWTVSYDRFLTSLGHASPEGDSCTFYSDAAYNRVLDMSVAGAQRVSIIYALGTCEIDFEVSSPWPDSVLGEGVSASDRDFMRTPGTDDYAADAGASVYVRGHASKNGGEKRFEWAFRHRIDYAGCFFSANGVEVRGVELRQDDVLVRDLTVHGGALFQDRLRAAEAGLAFEPFAAADDAGDADGEVTLHELGATPLTDLAAGSRFADADPEWKTLADYVYRGLLARIVVYQGDGACDEMDVMANNREPH